LGCQKVIRLINALAKGRSSREVYTYSREGAFWCMWLFQSTVTAPLWGPRCSQRLVT
jgi:hypothetical protein